MNRILRLTDSMFELCKDHDLSTCISALLSLATTLAVNSEDEEVMFVYIATLRELVDNLDKHDTTQ